jgi:hypothetical protein
VHDGERAAAIEWKQGLHARMESEVSVEIDGTTALARLWDGDPWTCPIVVRITVWYDHIQSVDGTSLEEAYECLFARTG